MPTVRSKVNNNKELWMDLGLKIGQALTLSKAMNQKFDNFIENEYRHLQNRVEKNTIILAGGLGALAVLQFVLYLFF